MTQDNLIKLSQPGAFSDLLTDVLRNGARALLAQAVEAEEAGNLGLHCLRQQRSRAVAQHIRQQIGKRPWLGQLDEIILGHGVSLLRWRSGGVEHPHDTPPYPFTPSPTFAHNSRLKRTFFTGD